MKIHFNIYGFIFNGAYYAGYGEFVKGLKMAAICGLCPILWPLVALYAGLKANSELPVKYCNFNWLDAIVVTLVAMSFGAITHFIYTIITNF